MSASKAPEPALVDLLHLGRARVVGSWLVDDVVVDPGPASCLPRLLEALGDRTPRAIALTHIHLDHAGASGSLVERFPDAEVWVHERGAPHMVDPSRLLASATRLYGEDMARLWGEFVAVPSERIRALAGGETLGPFRVAYTPGHASHHVAYLHEPTGWAFTGDVCGVRIDPGPVMAPTPPPDIDLRAWRDSLQTIRAWRPRALAVTHFGVHGDVEAHLDALAAQLDEAERMAGELDAAGFARATSERLAAVTDAETAAVYGQAMPPDQSYAGLARYLTRQGAGAGRVSRGGPWGSPAASPAARP